MKNRIKLLLQESVDEKKFRFLQRYIAQHYSEPFTVDHHEFLNGTIFHNFTFCIMGVEFYNNPEHYPYVVLQAEILNVDVEVPIDKRMLWRAAKAGYAMRLIKLTLQKDILEIIDMNENDIHVKLNEGSLKQPFEK
jgi:hypothetical protein